MTRVLVETKSALEETPNGLLAKQVRQFYGDPLGFVMMAYPWKERGTELEHESGPDETQKRFLIDLGKEVRSRGFNGTDPVMPILMTMTSGHGTGKSVMGALSRAPGPPSSTGPSCASPATGSISKRAACITNSGPRHGRSWRRPARRRTRRPSPANTRARLRHGTCSTKHR
jgi:hypothetical protein